ncbi:hypothetical protein RND81_02G208600 [Saponaria officinalis]|uniref:Uncharacterized protein n=1 Tax=Saponaria officinalis TaxID=3572 RepID=A0AAW1MSR0_SAPOF
MTERYENEHFCSIYVDCRKGPGAKLIHATALNVTISNVLLPDSDVSDIIPSLFDLGETAVNHDGHTRPLLSVQITELVDGVIFGFCANQSVVDGISFIHFQRVWSYIFMGSSSFSPPLVKKPAFHDRYEGQVIKLPYIRPSEFITWSTTESQLRNKFFDFSTTVMGRLKAKANIEVANSSLSSSRPRSHHTTISSFQALIAFVWRCITRVRNLPSDEITTCALPVNLRPCFHPPLSQEHFGVYYTRSNGEAKVGELLTNNIGWAAMLLHQVLVSLDHKTVQGIFTQAFDKGAQLMLLNPSLHSNNVIVAGLPRYDIYGPDFGLGAAVAHRGHGNKWDGKVNSYVGSEGKGSVELDICLAPDTMHALSSDEEFMSLASLNNAGLNPVSRI